MKTTLASFLTAAAFLVAGCGHLDLTPEGNPNRVLTGTVEFGGSETLPADTVIVVRVVDRSRAAEPAPTRVLGEPSAAPVPGTLPSRVLGEQVIRNPGPPPVSFQVAYTAPDEQLRHGLNVEVRVSVGGKVRYHNVNSYAVTLNNVDDSHAIFVNRIQ